MAAEGREPHFEPGAKRKIFTTSKAGWANTAFADPELGKGEFFVTFPMLVAAPHSRFFDKTSVVPRTAPTIPTQTSRDWFCISSSTLPW